jgi:valyl-tRNA synthetase
MSPTNELELQKSYDAKATDSKWFSFWNDAGYFRADAGSNKPPYCIVIPPPNVTGVLHMGHALVNTLQDILIRWKRMQGFEALWVPGTDHAGISTQTVVERKLLLSTGKRRKDFSRIEFLSHVWQWKEESEDTIVSQLKQLGCSCDWSRQRFTMDEGNNLAVRVMFKKLFDQGLIYRGDYLVNWDPVTQTAIADDEVEYEERDGFFWYFDYPLQDGMGAISIATTRPETMLGDTAIAVNPKDPRYSHLIGKNAILPLLNREIPIIADPMVDMDFGTGAVKITPAHDPNDYQMGLKHKLPMINIMTPDGHINENGGKFAGLSMEQAREAIVKALKELGLVKKIEPHRNRVGISYRSKATIEPFISKQWFVKMDGFAKKLAAAVEEKRVRITPEAWEKTYFYWINNLRDWCISRQLWWGHQIPIWYNKKNPEIMLCSETLSPPDEVLASPDDWEQDEDVLDTWFSSALWPFAALGWPEKTAELKRFYPNSTLITGHDILFFWVARMIMMGEYAMGEVPFPEVFLNGLIFGKSYWREAPGGGAIFLPPEERLQYELGKAPPSDVSARWEKMSKSKGNVIDPLEMIDLYGTDAVRITLCASASQQRQIDLDRRKFEEFKNFTNKVWNGARFVFMNLLGDKPLTAHQFAQGLDQELLSLEDHWILSKLNHVIGHVNSSFDTYQFDKAAMEAYDFFWKEFCAYYVEIAKPILFGKVGNDALRENKQKLLAIVLLASIRLLHPIAPFITEELFHKLKELLETEASSEADIYTKEAVAALQASSCIVAPYPKIICPSDINDAIEEEFALVEEAIYTLRNMRGEINVSPGVAIDVYIVGNNDTFAALQKHRTIIQALVRINTLQFVEAIEQIGAASTALLRGVTIVIPIPKEMIKQEKERLIKEQAKVKASLDKVENQLANQAFVEQAPQALVENSRKQREALAHELSAIEKKLREL